MVVSAGQPTRSSDIRACSGNEPGTLLLALAGDDPDIDRYRTESQKEWAAWSAHGYRKLYQPRSILWFGGIFVAVLALGLLAVFWLAASGRWP